MNELDHLDYLLHFLSTSPLVGDVAKVELLLDVPSFVSTWTIFFIILLLVLVHSFFNLALVSFSARVNRIETLSYKYWSLSFSIRNMEKLAHLATNYKGRRIRWINTMGLQAFRFLQSFPPKFFLHFLQPFAAAPGQHLLRFHSAIFRTQSEVFHKCTPPAEITAKGG